MGWLTEVRWSPYAAGAGIGILSWFTFLISKKPIGCSTAFARTSGMLEKIFRGKKVEKKDYYKQFKPEIDWEWMLVVGVIIGAFVSAVISGDFELIWIPSKWAGAFGSNVPFRVFIALVGGILLGFGARWSGGCTSGHGISGTLQLAVSSWISAVCFFAGGIITAFFMFYIIGMWG
ncbi:MAG: YeeE/YedE thiosulfate transporter family protein [Candidatus Delongbacteria bacterium]